MPADPGTTVQVASRPAALLWDFDGTLVDSEPAWHAAEGRLARELGRQLTREEHRQLVGLALVDSAGTILRWAGRTDLDAPAHADLLSRYALAEMARAGGVAARPGALELLGAARAAGIPCALVSMSYTPILDAFVATLPAGSFEVVVGGEQVTRGKPDPEPFLVAAARLGVAPNDCLVLEDSIPGTLAAERAGMPTLGVPFEQTLADGPRRRVLPTLEGLTLAAVSAVWRELADA